MQSGDEDLDDSWENLKTINKFDGCKCSLSRSFAQILEYCFPWTRICAPLQNYNLVFSFPDNDGILSTIGSTKIMGGSLIETMSSKATTPVSLLVESLVQQLCTMLDSDPCRSHHLYHTICAQLHQMNLIDNTYNMGEFEVNDRFFERSNLIWY